MVMDGEDKNDDDAAAEDDKDVVPRVSGSQQPTSINSKKERFVKKRQWCYSSDERVLEKC